MLILNVDFFQLIVIGEILPTAKIAITFPFPTEHVLADESRRMCSFITIRTIPDGSMAYSQIDQKDQ